MKINFIISVKLILNHVIVSVIQILHIKDEMYV